MGLRFKIVHRRGADRTPNQRVLIEHRKLNDHPIEVEASHLASPQRHCEFSTLKEVIVHVDRPMSVFAVDEQTSVRAILQNCVRVLRR